MPDMGLEVSLDAQPSASAGETLTPRQVIAATVNQASASMQGDSAQQQKGAQAQCGARSSQPSLIISTGSQRGKGPTLNGGLQSHQIASPMITPQKAGPPAEKGAGP